MKEQPEWQEFVAGVELYNISGGGHLLIGPHHLELRTGPGTKRISGIEQIIHQGAEVSAYRARAIPPWFNFSFFISDGKQTGLASFPGWKRKRMTNALLQAGFRVKENVSWTQRGQDRVQRP
jgi:hypothetical protein